MSRNLVFIDPGISGTGYAVWEKKFFNPYSASGIQPIAHGIIFNKNVEIQLINFKNIMVRYSACKVYIEDAAFMTGSLKGQAAARTGSVVKLAQYIGRLQQICADLDCEAELISVMKWKGTLPKKVVWDRIFKVLPDLKAKSHALDAIGLGLWKMRVINQGMKK